MSLSSMKHVDDLPGFNYHLLRNALNTFGKNLQQLEPEEYKRVIQSATKSFALESRVLETPEASSLLVTPEQLDDALQQIVSRYSSAKDFAQDMKRNGLDETALRAALLRELTFDGVMQIVASKAAHVTDLDIRLFYEMHHDRFEQAETRSARHILITVNPDFAENTSEAALERITEIGQKLGNRSNRFGKFASRYSECPTAMDGGKLGEVQTGQLFPELDSLLFSMNQDDISQPVESEMGFHILWCEKIKPSKRVPLSLAQDRIRETLTQRGHRNCQKNWINELRASAIDG
jgi:peptidyl-prolyl cis-trans isomerase C